MYLHFHVTEVKIQDILGQLQYEMTGHPAKCAQPDNKFMPDTNNTLYMT